MIPQRNVMAALYAAGKRGSGEVTIAWIAKRLDASLEDVDRQIGMMVAGGRAEPGVAPHTYRMTDACRDTMEDIERQVFGFGSPWEAKRLRSRNAELRDRVARLERVAEAARLWARDGVRWTSEDFRRPVCIACGEPSTGQHAADCANERLAAALRALDGEG